MLKVLGAIFVFALAFVLFDQAGLPLIETEASVKGISDWKQYCRRKGGKSSDRDATVCFKPYRVLTVCSSAWCLPAVIYWDGEVIYGRRVLIGYTVSRIFGEAVIRWVQE